MWESLTAIGVFLVSGLAFVAYRHPDGYRRIFVALNVLGVFAILALSAHDLGGRRTFSAIKDYLPDEKVTAAQSIAENTGVLGSWVWLAWAAFLVVINVLYWLHDILGHDPAKNSPKD